MKSVKVNLPAFSILATFFLVAVIFFKHLITHIRTYPKEPFYVQRLDDGMETIMNLKATVFRLGLPSHVFLAT